jgi:hypothetical protein
MKLNKNVKLYLLRMDLKNPETGEVIRSLYWSGTTWSAKNPKIYQAGNLKRSIAYHDHKDTPSKTHAIVQISAEVQDEELTIDRFKGLK